jgi:hypothetical protein
MINQLDGLESHFRVFNRELEPECADFMFYSTVYQTDDLIWQYGFFNDLLLDLEDKHSEYLDIVGNYNEPHPEFETARAKASFIIKIISEELTSRGEDITSLL